MGRRGCCFRWGMRRRWRRGWRSCWTIPRTAGSWGRRRNGRCRSILRGSKRHGRWGRFTRNFWRVQGDAPLSPLHPQGAASGSLELNEGIAVGAPRDLRAVPLLPDGSGVPNLVRAGKEQTITGRAGGAFGGSWGSWGPCRGRRVVGPVGPVDQAGPVGRRGYRRGQRRWDWGSASV